MSRRRRRRSHSGSSGGRSQGATLQALLLAIAALVMLLYSWEHLANGAAGCFNAMTQEPGTVSTPDADYDAPSPHGNDAQRGTAVDAPLYRVNKK